MSNSSVWSSAIIKMSPGSNKMADHLRQYMENSAAINAADNKAAFEEAWRLGVERDKNNATIAAIIMAYRDKIIATDKMVAAIGKDADRDELGGITF